ncbi:hypothetical protein PEDI_47500 [Persicobacter diffluens]|uniref:Uncharacterized protein n=1 Tax=Persicobacter diffluens TaxID=981 RepID=A0AAN5APU3_9BACT|nr:hypothetical protein PEDI_47500 [Persicobacter diffluens]
MMKDRVLMFLAKYIILVICIIALFILEGGIYTKMAIGVMIGLMCPIYCAQIAISGPDLKSNAKVITYCIISTAVSLLFLLNYAGRVIIGVWIGLLFIISILAIIVRRLMNK